MNVRLTKEINTFLEASFLNALPCCRKKSTLSETPLTKTIKTQVVVFIWYNQICFQTLFPLLQIILISYDFYCL